MSTFCPGCEHHWLACPEVSQSAFPADDPEWQDEEPPPPLGRLSVRASPAQ